MGHDKTGHILYTMAVSRLAFRMYTIHLSAGCLSCNPSTYSKMITLFYMVSATGQMTDIWNSRATKWLISGG